MTNIHQLTSQSTTTSPKTRRPYRDYRLLWCQLILLMCRGSICASSCLRYGNLWRFSRWRPSAILDFVNSKFYRLTGCSGPTAEIWRFFGFQNGGCLPFWIIKNSKC